MKRHFFLAVIGIAFLMIILGQVIGEIGLGFLRSFLPPLSAGVEFLFFYLYFIGIDAIALLYCWLCDKAVFRSMLWPKKGGQSGNTGRMFALGLLIGFGMNGLCILAAWLHGDLHFRLGEFPVFYLICAFLSVLIQSGAEEIVTRGYMLGALRERYPAWLAIGINSVFFGALHLLNPGFTLVSFLSIVLIGLGLSLVAYHLDSLWMCIAIHTAWNFTQNFLFGLPNSGIVAERSVLHLEAARSTIFYDAAFGVEGAYPSLVVELALCVCVLLFTKKLSRPDGPVPAEKV
ncbi:MAG: CPBP family intramembrane metalloprotease [Oscillospiraceae bacterium]|nr:CPBP family intramembrane metalloprotease [Oscillospiraceae bacterium]